MNNTYLNSVTLILLSILMLTACDNGNHNDLKQFVAETRTKYIGEVEPLPSLAPYENYQYTADKLRDPFRTASALVKTTNRDNGIKPRSGRKKEELENFPLSSLNMVGVINNDAGKWAIIRTANGTIFRVKKGNYIGQNHGEIIGIQESKIQLKEIVPDGLGGWIEKPNVLSLAQ